MTTRQFWLIVCTLMIPTAYQRTKFAINRTLFNKTRLRDKSKLNIHHGHWGLLIVFVSTWLLVFGVHDSFSIGLAGLGWGLMLDEIIPMLKMPSIGRYKELEVYSDSRNATIILVSLVVTMTMVVFLTHN